MNKGIVMQISEGSAIVMENGGAFNKVRCQPGWEVGQVVSLEARRPMTLQKKLLVAAACLAFVVSSVFASNYFLFSPVSYVSVDINPGISIGLNRLNRVVSTTAHNDDGAEALEHMNVRWMPHTDALGTLVESEAMQPHLKDGEYLVFTMYSKLNNSTLDAEMEPLLEAVQAKYGNLEVGFFWVDQDTFRQARSEQISPAKLLLAQRLGEAGGQLATGDVAELSIAQLCGQLYANGGCMGLEIGKQQAPGSRNGAPGGGSSNTGEDDSSNAGPGGNNGNNSGGNAPGSNNGNNSGGNDPNSNNGNNSGGNDPSSNNGNNSGGNDPNSNNGNNSGGNDPNSNNGNNSGGNDPNSNNGNNSGGNDPSSNNGNNSGGNAPGSNNGKGNSGKGNGNSSNNG